MIQLLKIRGNSIEPYLKDGDFAIIRKRNKHMVFHVGEYIVFHQKMYGILIKKIHHIDEQSQALTVHGSNEFSSDSRLFGDVVPNQVIGKVIFRIRA